MASTAAESEVSPDFIEYINRSLDSEEEFSFLRLEFLQRLNIVHLEVSLVRMKSRLQKAGTASSDDLADLKTALEDYATAIRNYTYLSTRAPVPAPEMRKRKRLLQRFFQTPAHDFNDPFHSHYAYFGESHERVDSVRGFFMQRLPSRLAYSHAEREERKREYAEGRPPKTVSRFVDRLVRFLIAFAGGVFLVVPMIVMTLAQSQTKSLVTVAVTVTLLAMILSLGVRVSNVETLVSTATYAAVLVVFVGTSSGSSGGS